MVPEPSASTTCVKKARFFSAPFGLGDIAFCSFSLVPWFYPKRISPRSTACFNHTWILPALQANLFIISSQKNVVFCASVVATVGFWFPPLKWLSYTLNVKKRALNAIQLFPKKKKPMALRAWIGWEKIHRWFKQGKQRLFLAKNMSTQESTPNIEKWLIDKRFSVFRQQNRNCKYGDQTQLRKENLKKKKKLKG